MPITPTSANRVTSVVMPCMAIVAALLGIVWGWIGIRAAITGGGAVAYVLIVFGFGGLVLGLALWNTWRTMMKARQASASDG